MQELDDIALLREYAARDSEPAFATLVTRHIDRVYSVALRHTRNPHHAEEITQAVFVILATKAKHLRKDVILEGWLYQTARLTALTFIRSEIRRARREQEAYMQNVSNENDSEAWTQIAPLLDAALAGLNETDRNAVVLRFFYGKSMGEIGTALGANEDTARMRINRAIGKLQKFFSKRGVTSTAEAITGAISANSVQVAPAILAKAVTATVIAKGATASTSILMLIKGTLKAIVWAKYKFMACTAAGLLLAGSVVTVAVVEENNSAEPDPVALLKKVAAAREKIKSGEMEFIVAQHDYKWNIQTNYSLLKVVFDGENRRFEQLQRESAIVSMAPDAEKVYEAKFSELNGDREALAQLGLIKFEDAHWRTFYDGKTITQFDPRMSASIHDPKEGSAEYLFDPRAFGFADNVSIDSPIEDFLGYPHAQSISMVGKEIVENITAWHIRVQVAEGWRYEFWIDVNHPTHVIKQESPNVGTTIFARFDEQNPNDPIPLEVNSEAHYGGDPRPWETKMVRHNTRYNVPIDPSAFTFAGLGMEVGTEINDYRISRRIGYWNGINLSKNLPRNAPRREANPVNVIENNPESLLSMKTDKSFIDERKIILWRIEMGIGLLILIFIGAMTMRHFQKRRAGK